MLVLSPFSGMREENCTEALNELSGQCWPQHQLTQLLIMTLIRAADGERATLNVRSLLRRADAPAQPISPRKCAKLWRLFFNVARPWKLRQQLDLKANSGRSHCIFLFFERHNSDKYNLFSYWNMISLVWFIYFASLLWSTVSEDPGYFKKTGKLFVFCAWYLYFLLSLTQMDTC